MCAVVHCYFISQHHRAIPKWLDNKFNSCYANLPERLALHKSSSGRAMAADHVHHFFTRCHDMAQVFVFGDARTCANLQNFVHSENVHQLVMRRMCGASHSNRTRTIRRRAGGLISRNAETADHRTDTHSQASCACTHFAIYIDKIP